MINLIILSVFATCLILVILRLMAPHVFAILHPDKTRHSSTSLLLDGIVVASACGIGAVMGFAAGSNVIRHTASHPAFYYTWGYIFGIMAPSVLILSMVAHRKLRQPRSQDPSTSE